MKRGGVFTKRFFRLLSVRVENAPDEGYSLDLVAEGAYAGHTYGSGDAWVSCPCTRTALSSSVTVDRAARSLSVPPAWAGYALQFFSTLLPSLLVEGLLLLASGFSWKQNAVSAGESFYPRGAGRVLFRQRRAKRRQLLVLFPAAPRRGGHRPGGGGPVYPPAHRPLQAPRFAYGLTANAASAGPGLLPTEPVWRFVVSIS